MNDFDENLCKKGDAKLNVVNVVKRSERGEQLQKLITSMIIKELSRIEKKMKTSALDSRRERERERERESWERSMRRDKVKVWIVVRV